VTPIALPHHGRVAVVTGVSRRIAIDAAIDLSYAVNTRGALRLSPAFAGPARRHQVLLIRVRRKLLAPTWGPRVSGWANLTSGR
jgi:hypothetical protein